MKKKRYSLVEVLTVILILAILIGISYGGYSVIQKKTKNDEMQKSLDILYGAIIRYHADKGVWPDVFSGTDAFLIDKDHLITRTILTKDERNIIEGSLTMDKEYFIDLWGQRVRAFRSAKVLEDMDVNVTNEARGVSNAGSFDLISHGPDRKLEDNEKGVNDNLMPRVN